MFDKTLFIKKPKEVFYRYIYKKSKLALNS